MPRFDCLSWSCLWHNFFEVLYFCIHFKSNSLRKMNERICYSPDIEKFWQVFLKHSVIIWYWNLLFCRHILFFLLSESPFVVTIDKPLRNSISQQFSSIGCWWPAAQKGAWTREPISPGLLLTPLLHFTKGWKMVSPSSNVIRNEKVMLGVGRELCIHSFVKQRQEWGRDVRRGQGKCNSYVSYLL